MKLIYALLSRFAIGFAWIMVFAVLASELSFLIGLLVTAAALTIFFFVHVKLDRPTEWSLGRLKFVYPRFPLLLGFTALILVLGDVFWLYRVKTSQDDFSRDPLLFYIIAITVIPLVEEFAFRLWMQSYLERFVNTLLSIIAIAFVFAMLHDPEVPIPQFLSGVLYGIALVITGSIWVPVALHSLNNGFLIIAGEVDFIRTFSFKQMDRADDLNLYIAVTLWIIGAISIFVWAKLNQIENGKGTASVDQDTTSAKPNS